MHLNEVNVCGRVVSVDFWSDGLVSTLISPRGGLKFLIWAQRNGVAMSIRLSRSEKTFPLCHAQVGQKHCEFGSGQVNNSFRTCSGIWIRVSTAASCVSMKCKPYPCPRASVSSVSSATRTNG